MHYSEEITSKLTRQQKREALESLMNLVKKRDGHIKARCAADGSKQRRMQGYVKSNATSSTVHNKSVVITAAIDAHEDRDVMIFNILGKFSHALTKDKVVMLVRGPLAETMVLIDPERYRPLCDLRQKRSVDIICENE